MNYPTTRKRKNNEQTLELYDVGKKQPEIGRIKLALQRDGATGD